MNYIYGGSLFFTYFTTFFEIALLVIFGLILICLKKGNKNKIIKVDKTTYYRDIPCSRNINIAYWLLYNYTNYKKSELNNGLIGAYLLKWYKNGYIDINSSKKLGFKDNYCIDLKDEEWTKNYVENEIYNFLKEVAGNNNLLEKNEIRNYCSLDENGYKWRFLFDRILQNTQKELEDNKNISVVPLKDYIFFKIPAKITLSDELINEYQNLIGLKNFLLDFSNMKEKGHIEVQIWEEYLIFANLFGIADKVTQQFRKLYPDFNIINTMFEFSLDGSLLGHLEVIYKSFVLNVIIGVVALILVKLIVFDKRMELLLIMTPILAIVACLSWMLKKHFMNHKVKEMNKTMYAKISDVKVHYDTNWDSEEGRNVTTKSYTFTYEYTVQGIDYKEFAVSDFRKRNGQRIKIYYNEMKPEKSETAEKHNYYLRMFKILMTIIIVVLVIIGKIFF